MPSLKDRIETLERKRNAMLPAIDTEARAQALSKVRAMVQAAIEGRLPVSHGRGAGEALGPAAMELERRLIAIRERMEIAPDRIVN